MGLKTRAVKPRLPSSSPSSIIQVVEKTRRMRKTLSETSGLASRRKAEKKLEAAKSGAPVSGGLVERTIRAIIEYMRVHDLRIGDPLLSEANFAQTLKVSRTVVREAFRALAALKVIDLGGGRRAKVAQADHAAMSVILSHAVRTEQMTVQQIWDVRRSLELRTGALAAAQRTEEEARAILFHAKAMRLATFDTLKRQQQDILFHQAIAKSTHNALFTHIIGSFDMVTAATMTYLDQFDASDTELSLSLHERIADCIARRDVDATVEAMKDHFDLTLRKLTYAGFR